MARTHYVRDKTTDTYFSGDPPHPGAKTRLEADLYEQHEACAMATKFYGVHGFTLGKWEIIEATPQEHRSWVARQGGRAGSDKQNRARRRNGERHGGRPRVCRACSGSIERDVPKSVHLCKKCQTL